VQRHPALSSASPTPAAQQGSLFAVPTPLQTPFTEQSKPLFELLEPMPQGVPSTAAGVHSKVRSATDGLFNLTYLSYAQRLSKLEGIFGNLNALLQEVEQSDLPEGLKTVWFQAIHSAQAQVLSVGQAMLPGGLSTEQLEALLSETSQPNGSSRLADQARALFDEAAKTELTQQLAQLKGALTSHNTAFETTSLANAKETLTNLHGLLTTAQTSAEVQGMMSELLNLIHEQQSVSTRAERGVSTNESPPLTVLEGLLFA
jgi:hypothetical protein